MEPYNGDFVREQVGILRQDGYKVDLIYADLNIAYLRSRITPRHLINVDQRGNQDIILSGPFWPKNNAWGLNRYVHAYAQHAYHYVMAHGLPKLIHAHTYLGAAVAVQLRQLLDDHIDIMVTEHYTGWMDDSIKSYHSRLGLAALNQCDQVSAVSPALAKCLSLQLGKHISVHRNFIDEAVFAPAEVTPWSQTKAIKLITIGDLIPRKQVDHAIRALSLLPAHYMLTIIGSGPEEASLKKIAANLGLSHRVRWTGQLSKYQVAQELRHSHLLVHPSKLETFGLVVLESLCSGVPVITYDNEGVSAFEHQPGIFITSEGSVHVLAQLIKEVVGKFS